MGTESYRFQWMVVFSLAVNLFILPSVVHQWFWSSRAERSSIEELHPAEVKTVTLQSPKAPPKPKLIPEQKIAHPFHHARAVATKPKLAPTAPRPHVMTLQGGESSGTSPAVNQGTGGIGQPVEPTVTLPPPLPKGETREAVSLASPVPEIPEELRSDTLKTFVRARFDIASDGSAQVTLLTSSGNSTLDQLTLKTLRQWRWKPALQNGVPVSSSQRLKIEFEVQ